MPRLRARCRRKEVHKVLGENLFIDLGDDLGVKRADFRNRLIGTPSRSIWGLIAAIMIAAASSEAVSVSIMNLLIRVPAHTISIWDFGSICKRYREIIPKVIVKFGAGDTVKDIVRNFCKEKKEYLRFSHPF